MTDLASNWPALAAIAGAAVLAWGQKDRLLALLPAGQASPPTGVALSPHELFSRLYDLRSACEASGHVEAVKALDDAVLPAIVRPGKSPAPANPGGPAQ